MNEIAIPVPKHDLQRRRRHFTQSDVKRAIKAARAAGAEVTGVHILPDGGIRIIIGAAYSTAEDDAEFDAWRRNRDRQK